MPSQTSLAFQMRSRPKPQKNCKPCTRPETRKPSTLEICAISISIIALFFTAYQSYLTKTHNLKSVEPRVNSYKKLEEDDYRLILFNNGLGPAFVEKITYFINGRKLNSATIQPAMSQLGIGTMCYTVGTPRPGDSLKKEEEIYLMKFKNTNICSFSKLKFALLEDGDFDFEIVFSSIYGERFSYRFSTNQQTKI